MKLLVEYLEHAVSFEAWRPKKTIHKFERNSKNRRRPIANSPLNARQDTGFRPRACRRESEPANIRRPAVGLPHLAAVRLAHRETLRRGTSGAPRLLMYIVKVCL